MPHARYVVLHHTGIPIPHYDLLIDLDPDSPLVAARCSDWPPTAATKFQRLPDHRRIYLEYEGEISNNRGSVKRIAAGQCNVLFQQDDSITLTTDSSFSIHLPPLVYY